MRTAVLRLQQQLPTQGALLLSEDGTAALKRMFGHGAHLHCKLNWIDMHSRQATPFLSFYLATGKQLRCWTAMLASQATAST
jgi:hypothetical protein